MHDINHKKTKANAYVTMSANGPLVFRVEEQPNF